MIGSVTNPLQQYVSPGLRTDQNSTVPSQTASPAKSAATAANSLTSMVSAAPPTSGRGRLVDFYA